MTLATSGAACVLGLHLHVLPDGRPVVHSHPVDPGSKEGNRHQHSAHERAIIAGLFKSPSFHSPATTWSATILLLCACAIDGSSQTLRLLVDTSAPSKRSPPPVTSA